MKHSITSTRLLILAAAGLMTFGAGAREVARFNMESNGGRITETVSSAKYDVLGVFPAERVAGAVGDALRLDGYSTWVDAHVGDIIPAGSSQMTASVWFAVDTYPIVEIDRETSEQVAIVSCLDETARSGFGFFIGFNGKYSFKTYIGGWPLELKCDTPLPLAEWVNLTAVIDADARTAVLYNNGVAVANSRANGKVAVTDAPMRIGRSFAERMNGQFCLTSFNGIIDDITVWNTALSESEISGWTAESAADMTIPSSRFDGNPYRPVFHGMPGANWTNESHGLTYSNGRYHIFFQKNANGPYMARLHWGHISSENLYDWREEKIALVPGDYFDIKGCWSGAVFTDDEITGGKPGIIYTAVDYAKATIANATPLDVDLISWQKGSSPIINGRPSGLSDDFRDPYFFRTDNGAYIIVGSSKDGVGTTTLHKYNPVTGMWSNDGKLFFTGSNAGQAGTFWEMPNVTKIGDKWIFTTTPLNTSRGVASLYWTGTIGADGTFVHDRTTPGNIEFTGFARDGYGLLSPSIFQKDGKTIALGIVPDKLMGSVNYELGFAHTYSLPREWSLDSEGNLLQKPYSGLADMREGGGYSRSDFQLNGSETLDGVNGRAIELLGEFVIADGNCGFTMLDDGLNALKVYFDAATNEIVVDARGLDRLVNDSGIFGGIYRSAMPRRLQKGETLKLNVFLDHSIIDIFVNDSWASSVRVFADAKSTESTTVFAGSATQVRSVKGWKLNPKSNVGISSVTDDNRDIEVYGASGRIHYRNLEAGTPVSLYDASGMRVFETKADTADGSIDTGLRGFHIVAVGMHENLKHMKVVL